ncbi:MAG: YceI family protein [Myxococcota bacterium]
MNTRSLVVAVSICAMGACGQSQLDGKPTATVEAVTPKPSAPTQAPGVKKTTPGPQPTAEKAGAEKPAAAPTPAAKEGVALPQGATATAAEKPNPAQDAKAPIPKEDTERDLVLDARRSSVSFVGRKLSADHEGGFGELSGTAKLVGYTPKALKVTIQTTSVSSDHPKLTNHLKSPDFFNTEKYPTARFTSTKIRPGGEGVATHTITGELSMLAVTKRITFPATIVVTDAGATGLAEFKINRKDFGIVYPGRPDDLITDEVLLKLNLAYLDKRYVRR